MKKAILSILLFSCIIFLVGFQAKTKTASENYQDLIEKFKDKRALNDSDFDSIFKEVEAHFDELEKMHQQMMKDFTEKDTFKDDMSSFFKRYHDNRRSNMSYEWQKKDKEMWLVVRGSDAEKFDIKINSNRVEIKGTSEKTVINTDKHGNKSTMKSMESISEILSVPADCDGEKVKIEKSKESVILKFPCTTVSSPTPDSSQEDANLPGIRM
ncbi:MAG: hypothetical protein HQK50_16485 [Oligoflexia bacterium]|nr:hypothetical protein [Oligoflexia bacterium]MBF0367175.1 hypothetical protein [Oligoflexia bacterium]